MRAGPMHDRIRIDAPVPDTVDGMLAPRHEWVEVWECAAQIDTVSSREFFSQQRENAIDGVRVRLRYPPVNVTTACRITDIARGIVYAIDAVLFDDKRTLMTLACTSGQNDG